MDYQRIIHPFPPIYNQDSRILILGTLPSVMSRENEFYYGHPRNRFWKLIAALFGAPVPTSIADKTGLLISNRIALWDVVYSCDIRASSDSSILHVIPTDLSQILAEANIQHIYANGGKAAVLYRRYQQKQTGIEITALPSTSPANAAWSLERLADAWSIIKES